ncbi:MAG: CpXC domain-containing protein [Paludibacteraceae bacterium]|nr:CpXC domain-containing protein [Paludibacteraceae bacterium]
MAEVHDITIKCPKCGEDGAFKVWTSVNATLNPELREKVLDGSMFHFHCEKCGGDFILPNPTLYHDMNHQFMVWLVANPSDKMPGFSLSGNPEFANYKCRVVSSLDELNEKIFIFESGLNDVVIEIIKHELRAGSFDTEGAEQTFAGGEFYFKELTRSGLVFVRIVEGTEAQPFVFPMDLYNAFHSAAREQKLIDLPLRFYCINDAWVKKNVK